MSAELRRAIAELEYSLNLLDGAPQPPDHFALDPSLSIVEYARVIVKLAKAE